MGRRIALLAGTVFGVGLTLSGMVSPARVLGFLDVAGAFDATLVLVLASALVVSFVGLRLTRGRGAPLCAERFSEPPARRVDARLVAGAALFGVGWGLGGFCPGPALAGLALGVPQVFLFVAALVAGVLLHDRTLGRNG